MELKIKIYFDYLEKHVYDRRSCVYWARKIKKINLDHKKCITKFKYKNQTQSSITEFECRAPMQVSRCASPENRRELESFQRRRGWITWVAQSSVEHPNKAALSKLTIYHSMILFFSSTDCRRTSRTTHRPTLTNGKYLLNCSRVERFLSKTWLILESNWPVFWMS